MAKRPSKTDMVFVALWVALLCAFPAFKLSSSVFGWPDFTLRPLEENRILARRPALRHAPVREWGRRIDDWYNDNFAWRSDAIRLYRAFRFNVAKSPIDQQVPGRGGVVFRRGGTWPEIEDYLGAIALDGKMRDDWRTLLEGRVAWAEAHGAHYIEAITPVKIQAHPELAPWSIRHAPGNSSMRQLEETMEGSFAVSNVLFFGKGILADAGAGGRRLFYPNDHHVSAYGCWVLYLGMVERMRSLWYPDLTMTPYFDIPPEDVRKGRSPGAWTDPDTQRLQVSSPGYAVAAAPRIGISAPKPGAPGKMSGYPQVPVCVRRDGDGLYLLMRHDSFMRFPLSSWRRDGWPDLAIPMGDGFSDIAMFIFKRFTTEELERLVGPRVPDVIVEQFPECKISLGVFGLDETMRRAAAFGNAVPVADSRPGGGVLAMAVFDNPRPPRKGAGMWAEVVDAEGRVVAKEPVAAGARRAVFFGAVEGRPPFSAKIRGGVADAARLELREVRAHSPSECGIIE